MFVLVLNAGSSSVKYQLFNMENKWILARGQCERIGLDGKLVHKVPGKDDFVLESPMPTHSIAIKEIMAALTDPGHGVIKNMSEIGAVGHRIVHGGPHLIKSTLVTPEVIAELEKCIELAPLHTGPHLMGIRGALEFLPSTPQVLVFDTAFHQTMPKYAYTYAIPKDMAEKYRIRRYGFHGTSHKYVSTLAIETLRKSGLKPDSSKIVTCHLGNGSSITAVKGGKVLDTSMGFTPLEGIVMGSRTGSMDPAIVTSIMEKEGFTPSDMYEFMNKQCGIVSVSGVSSDLRDIMDACAAGNEDAILALEILCYGIKKYIGSYAAVMGGIDAVVFTAGIGENNDEVRRMSTQGLGFLGIELDLERNRNAKRIGGDVVEISTPASRAKVYVIPTNEELVIAQETYDLMKA